MNYLVDKCKANGRRQGIGIVAYDDDDESFGQKLYLQRFMNRTSAKSKLDDISTLELRYKMGGIDNIDQGCVPTWKLWKYEIDCILSSYPKEWMIHEIEKDPVVGHDLADLVSFEPFWKVIIGNKALLPLLWSMYPDHPNLLPAYYDDPRKTIGQSNFDKAFGKKHWVSKPLFGREGIGIFFSSNYSSFNDFARITEENFGRDRRTNDKLGESIYQLYH